MTDAASRNAPDVKPGDTVAVKIGGQVYTDQVDSVRMSPAPYVAAPRRSRWQRLLRALTPRRWRAPLPYTAAGSHIIHFTLGPRTPWADCAADMARARRNFEAVGRAVDELMRP